MNQNLLSYSKNDESSDDNRAKFIRRYKAFGMNLYFVGQVT